MPCNRLHRGEPSRCARQQFNQHAHVQHSHYHSHSHVHPHPHPHPHAHAHFHHTHHTDAPQFHASFASPWPARHRQPAASASTSYTRDHAEPPASASLFKDLPALPASYRLGEGLPWDMGAAEPATDPDDLAMRPFARPTVLPIEGDAARDTDAAARREDPVHKKNLESLSAAMMTVDNGFESQWWNRGPKMATVPPPAAAAKAAAEVDESPILGTLSQFSALPPRPRQLPTQPSLGWTVAEPSSVVSPTLSELSVFSHSASGEPSVRGHTFPAVPRHGFAGYRGRAGRHDLVSPESAYASTAAPWSDSSSQTIVERSSMDNFSSSFGSSFSSSFGSSFGSNFGGSNFGRGRPQRRPSAQSDELFLEYC